MLSAVAVIHSCSTWYVSHTFCDPHRPDRLTEAARLLRRCHPSHPRRPCQGCSFPHLQLQEAQRHRTRRIQALRRGSDGWPTRRRTSCWEKAARREGPGHHGAVRRCLGQAWRAIRVAGGRLNITHQPNSNLMPDREGCTACQRRDPLRST